MNHKKTHRPAKSYQKSPDDQICNICRKKQILTDDHAPPKGTVSAKAVIIKNYFQQMIGDNDSSVPACVIALAPALLVSARWERGASGWV